MKDGYVCKYCGRHFRFEDGGGCNPADFGLHYSDKDVYGLEFTCTACDRLVTITNRLIKNAIDDGCSKISLQRIVDHVERVRDNMDDWRRDQAGSGTGG